MNLPYRFVLKAKENSKVPFFYGRIVKFQETEIL